MAEAVGKQDSRYESLYGPERTKHAAGIKQTMLQSSVLTHGQYNFIPSRDQQGIWTTSAKTDFVHPDNLKHDGNRVEPKSGHLDTHFLLGGEKETDLYRTSMTKGDFDSKVAAKQQGYGQDRTINWPDMAPQYLTERNTGASTYYNTHLNVALPPSTPAYPRVFSSNQRQPPGQDSSDVKFNRRVNVSLGSDPREFEAEHASSFKHPAEASALGPAQGSIKLSAAEISQNMQKLNRNSNVFRSGDYNNLRQEPGSIANLDFSKKSCTPSTFKIQAQEGRLKLESRRGERKPESARGEEAGEGMLPQMTRNYLQNIRQQVLDGALDGKGDQTTAHFVLGSDGDNHRSMYNKDFGKESRNVDHPKRFYPAPPGSQVLQFDPEQSKVGQTTSTKGVYAGGTFTMATQLNDTQSTQKNMAKRKSTSISLTSEGHAAQDRMASLSHTNYVLPPSDFKALRPQTTPKPAYNHLLTEVALPFNVNPSKSSETTNQYRGYSMDPENSRSRQLESMDMTKSRLDWGKGTHFVNGYAPDSYVTEHSTIFRGERKNDQAIPAAGTREIKPEKEFTFINMSENTQDMRPNPNRLDTMATNLHQKHEHRARSLPHQPVHKASIMANDYSPLNTRIYTPAQLMSIRKYEAMQDKNIEKSHFFHTDNSGNKNLQTTSMADFLSPEKMVTPRVMTSVK